MTKRGFDLICSLVGLLLFSPVFLAVAVLVYCDDRWPLFFLQDRAGQDGAPIRVIKFRTMRGGAVTRVGRWLRATGIDEVPQFINVLMGDMSMVGPRPLTREDIERLAWDQPRYAARWSVRPGITGLAQLHGGHSARVSWFLDRRYLQRQSIALDAWMVFLSFVVNIVGKRRVRRWLRGNRVARPEPIHQGKLG